MAKLKLPLLSVRAWGSFGKALTFARHKVTQYVKNYSAPTDYRSAKQDNMRRRFSCCIGVWSDLPKAGKKLWALFRKSRPWCKTNPFHHINLNTGYPCRETPDLPGMPYNRKSEWIVGLAKIGITPIGIKVMWLHE